MERQTRGALCATLTLMLALGATQVASAASWPMFGGGPGRSSSALGEPSTGSLPSTWTVTDAPNQNVYTTPVITQGARPLVVYGTQGPSSGGRVHIRDLVTGIAIGPSNGVSIDEAPGDADTMGGGNKASLSFVDTSQPGGAPGQAFIVYNDDNIQGSGNDVAIAQIDLATGDLVRTVPVPDTPHTRPPQPSGNNGTDVSSAPLLELDAAGNGSLVFRTGRPIFAPDPLNPAALTIIDREERVHVVPISNARSRAAVINAADHRATPNFYATSRTSPTLVTLTDGGAPATYVAMGTSNGTGGGPQQVRTFKLPGLESGPSTDTSTDALTGWIQTLSTPSTPSGLRAGAPGSGMATTPYLLVATGITNSTGTSRAYKLVQSGSKLVIEGTPAQFPGDSSPALATDALAGPGASSDGRVAITTGANLYVLRAGDLTQVAKFSPADLQRGCDAPCTPPPSSQTGFRATSPVIAGGRIYVARDDGSQLVLSRDTAQPVPASVFTQAAGNGGSTFGRGQPAAGAGYVVFAGSRGVFAYRTPNAAVPPQLGSPASGIAVAVLGSGPTTGPVIDGRPVALPRAVVGLRRSFRPRVSLQTRRTGTRTRIVRLRVTARRGWRVSVRCRGRGCPSSSILRQAQSSNPLRLKRLERTFGQATTIEVRVTRTGTVGTLVRYSLRPRRAAVRSELCLASGRTAATRCAR